MRTPQVKSKMAPLIAALENWNGRELMQAEIKKAGLFLPHKYQQYVKDFSSRYTSCNSASLDLFWNECAREYVCGAGNSGSHLRLFPDTNVYRSSLLDTLATERAAEGEGSRSKHLHPCLRRAMELRAADGQVEFEPFGLADVVKAEEVLAFGFTDARQPAKKKELLPLFQKSYSDAGFEWRKNHYYKRNEASGLEFKARFDSGGAPYVIQIPVISTVNHIDDPDLVMGLGNFDVLLPGFRWYFVVETYSDARLGLYAGAVAFNVFIENLRRG